jgi:bifunctional DNA-binding transcriptional regulator/antitoxin component of YhaV-PrlF toxin-antitoxin module
LNKWTLTVEEDPKTGDGILTFPEDLIEQAGWKEGDVLNWIDNKDGTWTLFKEDLTSFIHKGIINDEQN